MEVKQELNDSSQLFQNDIHRECPLTELLQCLPRFDDVIELFYHCKLCALKNSTIVFYEQKALLSHIKSLHPEMYRDKRKTRVVYFTLEECSLSSSLAIAECIQDIPASSEINAMQSTPAESPSPVSSPPISPVPGACIPTSPSISAVNSRETLPKHVTAPSTGASKPTVINFGIKKTNTISRANFNQNLNPQDLETIGDDTIQEGVDHDMEGNREEVSPKKPRKNVSYENSRRVSTNGLTQHMSNNNQDKNGAVLGQCKVHRCTETENLVPYTVPYSEYKSSKRYAQIPDPQVYVCRTHAAEAPLHPCRKCHKLFASSKMLTLHLARSHVQSADPRDPTMCCARCDKQFHSESDLRKHEETETCSSSEYTCTKCNKVLKNKYILKAHMMTHSEVKPFACRQCDKRFTLKSELKRHKQNHLGIGIFTCPKCGREFNKAFNYRRHLLTHSDEKPYKCSECDKCFRTENSLQNHRVIHADIDSVLAKECFICMKVFHTEQSYRAHIRGHENKIKPKIACEFCKKLCYSEVDLVIHRRTHTGEKPFKCDICDRSFVSKSVLNKHKVIHSGKKDHVCDTCGMAFFRLQALKRHHMKHTGEKPFVCGLCNRGFARQAILNSHALRAHGGQLLVIEPQQNDPRASQDFYEELENIM